MSSPDPHAGSPPVELLRRIPASPSVTAPGLAYGTETQAALQLAAALDAKSAAGDVDVLSPEALQALMASLCRYYGVLVDAQVEPPLLADRQSASGTEVMNMCDALLRGAGLAVFELGMWQSWQGR